jgi:uncharacterized iron-regulated membrane protein
MVSRHFFIWLHRWVGLAMAAFLILVGLTGSVIAFRSEIDQLVSPRFFAKPQPGVARLDFATLIDRAEALYPNGRVNYIYAAPRQIVMGLGPRTNPATGKPYDLGFQMLFLNPWTGEELARLKMGERGQAWLTNPIVTLHASLYMGDKGMWVLGVVALLWTIDCFVAFYLTLPATIGRFWQRWKLAWQVKWRASAFRVNFDLHRASGLWLWPALLVFAVSSVMFNLPKVYHGVADRFLEYHEPFPERMEMSPVHDNHPPRIDFRMGLKTAQHLMAEQAAKHGFTVSSQPTVFDYDDYARKYFYNVASSRDIYSASESFTTLNFNADTGALISLHIPTGEYAGNTVEDWLLGLHMVWVFGLPYRIFVCVLGLVIALLSYTGIYIWWKKRKGRKLAASRGRFAETR